MSLSEKDCYKKGLLWGVTILDVSKKINSLDDALDWLNTMNDLAKDTEKTSKKDDRGMKLLRKEIGNKELTSDSFKTFPKLINLIAMLNRIKKGSQKAWFGRTKQPGFQKSLDAVKKCVIKQIPDDDALKNKEFCEIGPSEIWPIYFKDFLSKIIELLNDMQNKIENGPMALKTLCEKLNGHFSDYINRINFADMTLDNYNEVSKYINGKFKDYFGDEISNILLKFLPKLVKRRRLQSLDLKFKNGDMNCKIEELNKFIDYIKKQSEDISKNEDFWDCYDKKLVEELNNCFKDYGVSNFYKAPELKNNNCYVLTDLWKLLAFVRGIWGRCKNRLAESLSFEDFLQFLYLCKDSECKKSINYICTKPKNCPACANMFIAISRNLNDESYSYYRFGAARDELKKNIDSFKQNFEGEINDFKPENKLTDEQYKNCLFSFLDRMNCYFDNIPLLPELKINNNNKEFIYKYT